MTDDARTPTLARSAKVAVIGIAFYAGTHVVATYLATSAILSGAVQALLAEWGAGRAGVDWTDPDAQPPRALARVGVGAALGLGAGALLVAFAIATRAASIVPGAPLLGQALVGAVVSAIGAVRDELLLRGIVMTMLVGWVAPLGRIAACALAGAAAAFGAGRQSVGELLVAALVATALGAVWHRDRGAWMAVGAHAGWAWTTGTLSRGGLVDVRTSLSAWGGGDAGLPGSGAAIVVTLALAAFAVFAALRPRT